MKNILRLILIIFILYVPSVYGLELEQGIIHTVDKFESVEGPIGATKIYFTGLSSSDDRVVRITNEKFKKQHVTNEIDGNTIRIYIKMENDDLKNGMQTYDNVALILLKQSAYYLDEEGNRVELNILINLESVDFKPITIAESKVCGESKQYWNKFSILNIKEDGVMYAVNRVLTDNLIQLKEFRPVKDATAGYLNSWDESWNKYEMKAKVDGVEKKILPYPSCLSNLHYVMSFTIKEYTGEENINTGNYGKDLDSKVASNMSLLWNFKDLDQPDDDYNDNKDYNTDKDAGYDNANIKSNNENGGSSSYMGEYSEGVKFNYGFSNDFYLLNGHTLRISDNKRRFQATQSTGSESPKNSNYSSVRGYQIKTTATIEWWGSNGLATGIVGITPKYEVVPNYTGNKCNPDKKNYEVTCDETVKRENSTETINGYFDERTGRFIDRIDNNNSNNEEEDDDNSNEPLPLATWTEHSSCSSPKVIFDWFFKDSQEVSIDRGDGVYTSTGSTCGPVTVSVPIVLTEDIDFLMSQPYGNGIKGSIYPGGGFTWDGAILHNDVSWLYSFLRVSNSAPLFDITYKYYLNGGSKKKSKSKFVSLEDSGIRLFTDANCSSPVTKSVLNSSISSKVSKMLEDNNKNEDLSNLTKKFTSVDYNDPSSKNTTVPVNNTTNKDSKDNTFNYTNEASLLTAYINVIDATVTYKEDDVRGSDKFTNGGNLYYVPLRYTAVSTWIEMKDKKLSIIGQTNKFSAKCELPVHQGGLIYKCVDEYCEGGDGDVKINYRYRTIDVKNPFNNKNATQIAATAQNWSDWYQIHDNQIRLRDTYNNYPNNPLYRVVLNNYNGINYNDSNTSYISFNQMNSNGTSGFIDRNKDIFIRVADKKSYCGLGIFKPSCDVVK